MRSDAMPRKPKHVADQLREAIKQAERDGITRYRIAQDSGVSEAQLSRLIHGKFAPRLDTAEAIAGALGKRITLTDP